jgi:AcrR family transcriptional regulator
MTVSSSARRDETVDGTRADRTRSAILAASRQLFLERGFAGTPVNAITEACGISNGGFYTYFSDKRAVFNVLGQTAYREVLTVLDRWRDFPADYGLECVRAWVEEYFAYMDVHGAFVMAAAHSAPDDETFRRSRSRMMSRAAWKLGHAIAGDAHHSPEAIGVAAIALLDRSWYAVYQQTVPVERDEVIGVVAEMLLSMTGRQRA